MQQQWYPLQPTTHKPAVPIRLTLALALILFACADSAGLNEQRTAETYATASTTCPVTQPPSPPLVPPAEVSSQPPTQGQFWYGNEALWTLLRNDGTWRLRATDGRIGRKIMWWRVVEGQLTIEGRRLDGDAQPLEASVPDGYGPIGFQSTGVTFPTPGCWQIIGRIADRELRFVVNVVAEPQ